MSLDGPGLWPSFLGKWGSSWKTVPPSTNLPYKILNQAHLWGQPVMGIGHKSFSASSPPTFLLHHLLIFLLFYKTEILMPHMTSLVHVASWPFHVLPALFFFIVTTVLNIKIFHFFSFFVSLPFLEWELHTCRDFHLIHSLVYLYHLAHTGCLRNIYWMKMGKKNQSI